MGLFSKLKSLVTGASESVAEHTPEVEEEDDDPTPEQIAEEEWQEIQAFIARCESSGLDLAGLDINDPGGYWRVNQEIDQTEPDGNGRTLVAQKHGFRDLDHWDTVARYFQSKWSHKTVDEDGEPTVQIRDEFTNALLTAHQGQFQATQAAAAAADPTLLAPVEGVSVDLWAQASAAMANMGNGASQADCDAKLAELGLDRATYDKASAGWQAKMQGDTTFVIATKYGAAFSAAQGQTPDAGEPCTFEHLCEIMAAMDAWSEQGIDVNAQLQATFGINAATYSKYSSYWSPKMATDVAMSRRHTELTERYKQKYSSGVSADDDLSL